MMDEARIRLYDALSSKLRPVSPCRPGEVRVSICSRAAADVAPLDYARTAVVSDVLIRHLRGQGMRVTYVQNIPALDDPLSDHATESGEAPLASSACMGKLHREDISAMGCSLPAIERKASEARPDILVVSAGRDVAHEKKDSCAAIRLHTGRVHIDARHWDLVRRGADSKSLDRFAPLSLRAIFERNDPEALRYFLLAARYRTPVQFDINEHCIRCSSELPLRDSRTMGLPRSLPSEACLGCGRLGDGRFVLPDLREAERRIDYLYQTFARLEARAKAVANTSSPANLTKDVAALLELAVAARGRVDTALDEDLNTPVALSVIGEVAKAANKFAEVAQKSPEDTALSKAAPPVAVRLLETLRTAVEPLGLLQTPPEIYRKRTQKQRLALRGLDPEQLEEQLNERMKARQNRDFTTSDAIRKMLDGLGIEVVDAPQGSTWRALV